MFIWANYKESKRKGKLIRLLSKIENLEGYIKIDNSSNKSGLDTSYHEFPTFKSNTKNGSMRIWKSSQTVVEGPSNTIRFKFPHYWVT